MAVESKIRTPYSLTKDSYDSKKVYDNLDVKKRFDEQDGVFLQFKDQDKTVTVSPGLGFTYVFQGSDGKNYILGSFRDVERLDGAMKLQISTGAGPAHVFKEGSKEEKIQKFAALTLEDGVNVINNFKAKGKFPSASEFTFSRSYFCNRNHGWDMCYVTVVAVSKNKYTLEQLKEMANSINASIAEDPAIKANPKFKITFGIYEADQELLLAAEKANELLSALEKAEKSLEAAKGSPEEEKAKSLLEEAKDKQKTDQFEVTNHLTGNKERNVILDSTSHVGLYPSIKALIEPSQTLRVNPY